jgi:hypothetical protein
MKLFCVTENVVTDGIPVVSAGQKKDPHGIYAREYDPLPFQHVAVGLRSIEGSWVTIGLGERDFPNPIERIHQANLIKTQSKKWLLVVERRARHECSQALVMLHDVQGDLTSDRFIMQPCPSRGNRQFSGERRCAWCHSPYEHGYHPATGEYRIWEPADSVNGYEAIAEGRYSSIGPNEFLVKLNPGVLVRVVCRYRDKTGVMSFYEPEERYLYWTGHELRFGMTPGAVRD